MRLGELVIGHLGAELSGGQILEARGGVGIVREAELPKDARLWSTAALGYYILGYVTDVQAMEAARAHSLTSALKSVKKQLDPKKYPELAALGAAGLERLMTGEAFRERFEFGLEVILEGLRAYRRRSRKKPHARAERE